jgi:predicted porin
LENFMKKTLVALAALVSASAFAQSSVTLYGVVDASIENVKGAKSVTRVTSDNLASSRLGFRGVEDIGGGLKGKFTLETAVAVDTGANGGGTTRFFDRAAWLGLEGGFGELRLGRQDSSIGAIAGNSAILGTQAYDDLRIANMLASSTYRRVDNGITYILPKLVDGLSAQVQYSTAVGSTSAVGTETSGVDTGEAYGLNAQYVAGPLGLGLGYVSAKQNATGSQEADAVLVYGSYDFGLAKVTAYFEQDDSDSNNTSAAYDKRTLAGLKAAVPFSKDFTLTASVAQASNVNFVANADALIVALKGQYNLSKRTAVYGLLTAVDNDTTANIGVAQQAPGAGKSSHGIAFGVRHAF